MKSTVQITTTITIEHDVGSNRTVHSKKLDDVNTNSLDDHLDAIQKKIHNFCNNTDNSEIEHEWGIENVSHNEPITPFNTFEKGHIYFFYRPKIGVKHTNDLNDVQKMIIVLSNSNHFFRVLRIGKKKLPSTTLHNRYWGIIEEATEDLSIIRNIITSDPKRNQFLFPFILFGEGLYAIFQNKRSTHLAYVLEHPKEIGEVQRAFNIEMKGSFSILAKNPNTNQKVDAESSSSQPSIRASLPKEIQDQFGGRMWDTLVPLEMLDYKGIEIVLIGESNDLVREFGQTGRDLERESIETYNQQIFGELQLDGQSVPVDPLIYGQWK